jgi:drug/metabolite transporter (DMT)-like permease
MSVAQPKTVDINPTYSAIYGELVLALYPILIKSVPTTLLTQTLARFSVFPLLAASLGPWSEIREAWGTPSAAAFSAAHGLLNLVHVGASYLSYQDLPAGSAVALFYTYPIMILVGRALFFNEALPAHAILFFAMALIGTYLISTGHHEEAKTSEKKWEILRGIGAALTAAFTETLIYFFVRGHGEKSPFYTIQHLYPAGLLALLAYGAANPRQVDSRRGTWLPLIAFNALLGFSGYIFRFFSIPKLSTIVFSMLSFIGVMAAYGWGMLFAGEVPSAKGLSGGGLIAGAIAGLRYFS